MALRDGWVRCDGCGAAQVGLSFSVVDGNRIVVPVEAMDEGSNGGFANFSIGMMSGGLWRWTLGRVWDGGSVLRRGGVSHDA